MREFTRSEGMFYSPLKVKSPILPPLKWKTPKPLHSTAQSKRNKHGTHQLKPFTITKGPLNFFQITFLLPSFSKLHFFPKVKFLILPILFNSWFKLGEGLCWVYWVWYDWWLHRNLSITVFAIEYNNMVLITLHYHGIFGENGQMPLSKKKNPVFCPISQIN